MVRLWEGIWRRPFPPRRRGWWRTLEFMEGIEELFQRKLHAVLERRDSTLGGIPWTWVRN